MAVARKTERLTPADDLRQLLSRSEDRLVDLNGQAGAAELYGWLDEIAGLLPQVQATGADLRAEEARWQSVQERLLARGPQVLRAWQGSAGLAAARRAAQPEQSQWWWWIDERLAEQRRTRLRRSARTVVILVVIVAVAAFVLQRLFPVDPNVRSAYRLQLQAEVALENSDLAQAYQALQQAIDFTPDNPSLWILHGAVAEARGDVDAAEQSWQQARGLLDGREAQFLIDRSLAYLRLQQAGRAIIDLEAAIALDPASARAQLALGNALQAEDRWSEALAAYEQAAELADAAGNAELVAIARVQIANLLPRMQLAPQP